MSMYMGRNEAANAITEALELLRKYPHQLFTYNPNDVLANSVVTYLKKQGKITVNRFHQFQAAPKYRTNPASCYRKNPSRKRTKYYIVVAHFPVGVAYANIVEDTHGDDLIKFRLQNAKQHASMIQNVGTARRYAKIIERTANVKTSVEDLDAYKPNPSKKRGAPGIAERSAKLHKIRKLFVKDMNAAKRNGNRIREDYMIRKINKLDRILFSQPGNTMRAKLKNAKRRK